MQLLAARDQDDALTLLRQHKPQAAVIALGHAATSNDKAPGLQLLGQILDLEPATKVWSSAPGGSRARAGGDRPWRLGGTRLAFAVATLRFVLERGVALTELEREHRRRLIAPGSSPLPGVLGESPAMLAVCQQVQRVAPTDASVVLTGESGTGKEVMARALHAASRRQSGRSWRSTARRSPKPCSESELFGYERGAFTGAVKLTPGRIEVADGGTLFLDEIGDLPLSLQAKLLRFLQERVIERIGGRREIAVDVRLVCATHRDLRRPDRGGQFSRGPLLPAERDRPSPAAATRARRRRHPDGPPFHGPVRRLRRASAEGLSPARPCTPWTHIPGPAMSASCRTA